MTNPNDKVQWYDHGHGFRMYFPNGYGLSIVDGRSGDMVEVLIVNVDGDPGPDWPEELVTPEMLGNYINQIRDLPPRTGGFPLDPHRIGAIEGGVIKSESVISRIDFRKG